MPATQATGERTKGETPAPAKRPLRPGGWSESALRVLRERYLAREGKTLLETPEEMCWRVAACIARAEAKYGKTPEQVEAIAQEFYDLMADSVFLPNSPTLMNAGKDNGLQYSACYVLPVGDSMEEIFESVKNAAIIHKCLVGETLVMTDRGLARLSEVADGAVVMTDEGPFAVSACHDNGEQPVFEVRTHRGFRVVGTAEHRLLVVGDDGLYQWRRIGELREGDWLILKPGSWIGGETKLPEFVFAQRPGRNETSFKATEYALPRELTPELAELIGLYIGDGSNHRDGIRFTVGTASPEIVERIKDLSGRLFGKKVTISPYGGGRAVEVSILSTQIRQWFEFLGITKTSSHEAHVPQIVLQGTEEVAAAFVRGLFSADGCIRENGHITLTSASEMLAEDLQVVMLALGIPTHLRRDVSEAGYRSYQLSVCTKAGFLAFKEKVGFLDHKKQERLAAIEGTVIFVKGETIPNQRGRLRNWYDALPGGTRVQARAFFGDLLNRVKDPRELSRQRVTAVMEKASLVPPFFGGLAAENLLFSRVTAVGYVGTRRVYDLTVPQKHAYLANGFVSHNSGGGTGFAFSRLRPKDALVRSTGGKASGPVSFLRVFNGATEAVKQGGTRRGANMGILRVDHPDILEFIESKLDGGITNFNISVAVTERFMEALKADGEYDLVEPHTGKVTGRLRAREVFDRIVQAAWKTGDPGLFFVDRCNAGPANPTPTLDKVEATNPCGEQPLYPNEACFAPETRITTDRGLETVAELYARYRRGETVLVATNLNGQGRHIVLRPAVVVKVGMKPTVRVTLANGQQIRVTPDHRILTQEGWKEAGALSREDRVCVQTGMAGPLAITSTDGDLQRMLGWFTGDGWFTNAVGLTFGPEDESAFQRLLPVWRQFTGSATRVQTQSTMVRCIATERAEAIAAFKAYGFAPGRGPEKRAPKFVFTAPKEEQIRYLQGLFGADGSKTHRKSQVTLSSASLELLRDVQLLLLNLGMRSNIKYYPHRPTGRAWGQLKVNGEGYHRFLDLIGFPLTPQKQERCDQFRWQWTKQDRLAVGVASVVADEEVEVYDVSEPVTHSLIAEGMIVHNCNLGSINLAKFVKPGDAVEQIDWAGMERAVRLSVRFLDDVIEVNPYPLAEINEAVKRNRRIGLGVMGWADMLCCLGIPYDSEVALGLADRVMAFIQEKGHDESRRLAAERGPFPTWPQSIYRDKGMLRNSTVTTIAPTGTISIIADCSSGIEPLFAVAFEHRVGERRLSFVNKHFEAVAKARGFYSEALMQKVAEQGTLHGLSEVPEDVRRVFVTAHEVAPEWHVRHQAAYQRHTDNGVSKTANLPNSATPDDVRSAYMLAYETGCIGITVFRDGCKGTQVLHVGTGAKEKEQAKEPAVPAAPVQPRPRVVQGVTYRTETPLGTAYITVNQSPQGEPLEVFANVGKVGSETAAVSEAIGRLVSLCLRLASPVPPKERVKQIVEQLAGIGGSRHLGFGKERVRSLPDAIAKVLAEHVGMIEAEEQAAAQLTLPERTGPPIKVGDPCPDCGEATLAYEEGCLKCYGCGFAEC
jgi:ribonucleoside-diphosphate reductase alpha chain